MHRHVAGVCRFCCFIVHRSYFMVCLLVRRRSFVAYAIFCCCFLHLNIRNYKITKEDKPQQHRALRSNRIYEECKYSVKARTVTANGSQINTSEMHLTRTFTAHTQFCIPTHQQSAINKKHSVCKANLYKFLLTKLLTTAAM